jgi:phosphopantothenoylcysteine decarboxylase/phosphopantothenate--cysteine ligase
VKHKKGPDGPPVFALVENPDILAGLAAPGPLRPALVVGFAAETGDLEAQARAKRARKGCDWIVANDVAADADGASVMGGEENEVLIIDENGAERWPRVGKREVARRLGLRIAAVFREGGEA